MLEYLPTRQPSRNEYGFLCCDASANQLTGATVIDTATVTPPAPTYTAFPVLNTTMRVNLTSACAFEALGVRFVSFQIPQSQVRIDLGFITVLLEILEELRSTEIPEPQAEVKI